MALRAGDLFQAQLPDGTTVPHLCIALTDVGGMCSTLFVVPIMTPTPKSDRTTMMPTIECPEFLQYDSCVVYRSLVEREVNIIEALIVHRYPKPVSASFLAKVIDGVFKSPLTERGVRQRFKDRLSEI